MEQIFNFIKNFFNKKTIILSLVVLLVLIVSGIIISIQNNKINKIKNQYETEVKLRNAIESKIDSFYNVNDELVLTKKTLQSDLKRLNELKDKLTQNQKELLNEINSKNKNIKVLAAANIKMQIKIDSLNKIITEGEIDTLKNIIIFKDSTKYINYKFKVDNVQPFNDNKPVNHSIEYLILNNEQYVEFNYDDGDKKQSYPISFDVKNSNKYMKPYDIDSYIIEEIDIPDLEKGFFGEIWDWYKNQSTFIKLGTGVFIGGGVVYIVK